MIKKFRISSKLYFLLIFDFIFKKCYYYFGDNMDFNILFKNLISNRIISSLIVIIISFIIYNLINNFIINHAGRGKIKFMISSKSETYIKLISSVISEVVR